MWPVPTRSTRTPSSVWRALPLAQGRSDFCDRPRSTARMLRARRICFQGLKTMHDLVLRSSGSHDDLPVTPFRFDAECSSQPTSFEVVCVADGIRYQYGFSATTHGVTDEWLYAWPSGRLQVWFERNRREGTQPASWKLGGKLRGDREVWKRATRANDLFLSTAVGLNSEQLRPIFDWFDKRLHVAGLGGWDSGFSVEYCRTRSQADVIDFLTAADLPVADMRIVEKDMPPEWRESIADDPAGSTTADVFVQHQPRSGRPAELDMNEESHGTRKLFALAGPWLDALAEGKVVVFDGLHEHLHPELVRFLVGRFHDPSANPHGAQLVFTTHARPFSIGTCFGLIRFGSASAMSVSRQRFSPSAISGHVGGSRIWAGRISPGDLERFPTSRGRALGWMSEHRRAGRVGPDPLRPCPLRRASTETSGLSARPPTLPPGNWAALGPHRNQRSS